MDSEDSYPLYVAPSLTGVEPTHPARNIKSEIHTQLRAVEEEPPIPTPAITAENCAGVPNPEVKNYTFAPLRPAPPLSHAPGTIPPRTYPEVKERFGSLARTDPEHRERRVRDRRFTLNALVQDPLAVSQEEARVFEARVQERITELSAIARHEAAEAGFLEGLERGMRAAREELRESLRQDQQALHQLVQSANQALSEIFQANETFLLDLVFKLARLILLRDLSLDDQYIVRLVKELIGQTSLRDSITLKLNPEDAALIEKVWPEMQEWAELKNLKIIPSPQMTRGGCQLETEWSAIESTLEMQLTRVREALIGHRPSTGTSR